MIQLDRNFWVAAAGLANTRTSQFDKWGRKPGSDRGPLNLLVDIQGAACELIALKYITDFVGATSFEHTMLDKHGANGLDMVFTTPSNKTFKLDVKGLFVTDMNRKWRGNFLINPRAVEKASIDGLRFAPVITTFGANHAYVGNLITWDTVMGWPLREWAEGDASHAKPLAEVVADHFRLSPEKLFVLRDSQFKLAALEGDLEVLTLPTNLPDNLIDQRKLGAADIIYRMCEHIDLIQKVG
jgi:hypothetical protein